MCNHHAEIGSSLYKIGCGLYAAKNKAALENFRSGSHIALKVKRPGV
jgi:hypothetical protein